MCLVSGVEFGCEFLVTNLEKVVDYGGLHGESKCLLFVRRRSGRSWRDESTQYISPCFFVDPPSSSLLRT